MQVVQVRSPRPPYTTEWARFECSCVPRRPRVLRAEPELFATLRLVDRSRKGSISNISGNMFSNYGIGLTEANAEAARLAKPGPMKCPAEQWANVIASKASCLTALDLSGNHKAPLTALKACLRAVPSSLKSLNLDGVDSTNLGTLKEARAAAARTPWGARGALTRVCAAHRSRG